MELGLSLHSFCQNSFVSCLQGKEYSHASKKKNTATGPKSVCIRDQITPACPRVQRAWGYPATARTDHRQPPPEGMFCNSQHTALGGTAEEADPQCRCDEQGQRYEGGRKGPADPNPKNHHPDEPKYWVSSTGSKGRRGLEAPTLVTQSGP